jgi:hypothetical protein
MKTEFWKVFNICSVAESKFFCLLFLKATPTSFLKIKSHKKSHKTVGTKGYLTVLLDDRRVRIRIEEAKKHIRIRIRNTGYLRQLFVCVCEASLLPGVCQVRVDFVDFHLRPSNQGSCSPDNRFKILLLPKRIVPIQLLCGQMLSRKKKNNALDNVV